MGRKLQFDLRTRDAAKLLGYCIQYTRILAQKGKIPAIRRRGGWRYDEKQLLKWMTRDDASRTYPIDSSPILR